MFDLTETKVLRNAGFLLEPGTKEPEACHGITDILTPPLRERIYSGAYLRNESNEQELGAPGRVRYVRGTQDFDSREIWNVFRLDRIFDRLDPDAICLLKLCTGIVFTTGNLLIVMQLSCIYWPERVLRWDGFLRQFVRRMSFEISTTPVLAVTSFVC